MIASEYAAASQFAGAYVRFLDGAGPASSLPDGTAPVRALAATAGAIPGARRRGTLVLTHLQPAAGENNSYLLAARDDAHTFFAQVMLAEPRGRWLVVQLTPPDFVQVFAPAAPPPPAPPRGSAGPRIGAQHFLAYYLPWLYGLAPLRTLMTATVRLLAGLKAHPPRVPPTMRALRAKVEAIAMERRGGRWLALANITDGAETYELVLTIAHTHGRWLVSNVSSPR